MLDITTATASATAPTTTTTSFAMSTSTTTNAPSTANTVPASGRNHSYITSVTQGGDLVIDERYTRMLDLREGDRFLIKLGREKIRFIPLTEGLLDDVQTWGISRVATVQADRSLSISKAHTQLLDLVEGSQFYIKLSHNSIRLIRIID